MYDPMEIEISKRYLQNILEAVDEPMVVLGGWAVYFLVNDRYKENTGREYIGSRDIDLGFKMEGEDLQKTDFAKSCELLIHELGFRPQSFRLFKQLDSETGRVLEIDEAKSIPQYRIITMYVDLVVSSIPEGFKDTFGFTPIDEPLLDHVFEDESNRIEIKRFGREIWVPSPEILLATKIKSYPNRDKHHKRIKDACDISALMLFNRTDVITEKSVQLLDPEIFERFNSTLNEEDVEQVSNIITIDKKVIESVLTKIIQ